MLSFIVKTEKGSRPSSKYIFIPNYKNLRFVTPLILGSWFGLTNVSVGTLSVVMFNPLRYRRWGIMRSILCLLIPGILAICLSPGIYAMLRPGAYNPIGFRICVDITLIVASQRSNQFGQRVRLDCDRPAGRLGCHIPSFLNGTRHSCLVTRYSQKARNMITSWLWMNDQCAGLYPSLWTSPQCYVPAPTTPLVFEFGLRAYSKSRASALTNSAKGSEPLARGQQVGWVVTAM